jgi:two-component system, OmpR family, sensor kinase
MSHTFSRISLRTKLVASAVALVFAALTVIGVISALLLRKNLVDRIDRQLAATATTFDYVQINEPGAGIQLPSNWLGAVTNVAGAGRPTTHDRSLSSNDLPTLVTGTDAIRKKAGKPYTVTAPSGKRWRMLVTVLPNGDILHLGEDLSTVDETMGKFIVTELIVGGSVLVLLGVVAAGMVRVGLRPLDEIERTAGAIAAGDLTQRVPDREPGVEHPHTEMGRLGRALNAMLGQIEAAFTARASSEAAARLAETQARDAAEQAQVSERRARRSEEKMRQFVADASHELRTPLTTIRGFAELYRQGAAREPGQTESLLKRIEDEAARMGLLVEDLLLLARLDEERPLQSTPVELRVLAVDAVSAARAVAPEREVSLEVAEGTGELTVLGDESRLRQVIGNLMTNALTHTPAGTPVWLRLSGTDTDAVVEVADAGPGLTPEQRERVFERFYRVDAARTRREAQAHRDASGAGLGLAIVAALVAAHGGRVDVDSAPGQGATFRVVLPREATEQKPDLVALTHS